MIATKKTAPHEVRQASSQMRLPPTKGRRRRRGRGLGHLGPDEAIALERERRVLCRLRYGLHLVAGRREERLRFDYQKLLAARLGYDDDSDSLGVEKMMQGFYRSAAIVRRINDRLLQRFEEHFDGAAEPQPLDDDLELRRGYLASRRPGCCGAWCAR